MQARYSNNEDIMQWPVLIGESGSAVITCYVRQRLRAKRRTKSTTSKHDKYDNDSDGSTSSKQDSDATVGTQPGKSTTSKMPRASKTSNTRNTERTSNTDECANTDHTTSKQPQTTNIPNKTPSASSVWWDSQAAYDASLAGQQQ
jgi:hypothetical protein